jgi:general secretion pathway protein H
VLVVVVIIAVMTTLAVLSVGALGADHGLETEGDRYTDALRAASEQAGLESRDYGVWFDPDGYQLLVYIERRARWEAIADDRLYAYHAYPPGVHVALELEGRPVALGLGKPSEARVPQVLLYSSGEASPYRAELTRAGSEAHFIVEGRPDGTLVVTRPAVAP